MHDEVHPSGATPIKVTEESKSKLLEKQAVDSTAPDKGTLAGEIVSDSVLAIESLAKHRLNNGSVNPHCSCNPCRCEPPCTCGLELKAREIRSEWNDNTGELVYTLREVWKPQSNTHKELESS